MCSSVLDSRRAAAADIVGAPERAPAKITGLSRPCDGYEIAAAQWGGCPVGWSRLAGRVVIRPLLPYNSFLEECWPAGVYACAMGEACLAVFNPHINRDSQVTPPGPHERAFVKNSSYARSAWCRIV